MIVAPLGPKYPSVNETHADSYRGGRKNKAYRDLFAAVKLAAEAEIARVGWETATYYCATSITLYRNTRREIDLGNVGKCEADALTKAGVWSNDKLAKPYVPDTEYDPMGDPRVVITVRRRFPDLRSAAIAPPKRPPVRKPRAAAAPTAPLPCDGRMAEVNGKPVPVAQVMAELKKRGWR